jgi:hypothetical protein|tara:strand:+ start:6458 stop:6742 length:285 start_codon:yes stop_codon:yes gene_type:complete
MTQTLEERIAEFKQIYTGLPKAKDALEIIIELQAENQALLAKVETSINYGMLKLNQKLAAKVKELEGKVERLTVLVEDLRDPFNKNRRGEKHGE